VTNRKIGAASAPQNPRPLPRGRSHTLAPEHLGELGSVAALICAVGGLAVFIAAVAMIVGGLTIGSTYTGGTPPNVSSLGTPQILGGIGLAVLGAALVAAAAALLADMRYSRRAATVLAGLATLLAAAGAAALVGAPRRDTVLVVALAVAFVVFGGATVVLARGNR